MGTNLIIYQGDITLLNVDATVNAANESLLGGGGVDGAIHRAAGPELLEACKKLNGCQTGQAVITKGFKLPAEYIIHAVGPVYKNDATSAQLLASCYRRCMDLAVLWEVEKIAFPCISTGIYGYPPEKAVKIVKKTIMEFLEYTNFPPEKIIFCVFSDEDKEIYEKEFGINTVNLF